MYLNFLFYNIAKTELLTEKKDKSVEDLNSDIFETNILTRK